MAFPAAATYTLSVTKYVTSRKQDADSDAFRLFFWHVACCVCPTRKCPPRYCAYLLQSIRAGGLLSQKHFVCSRFTFSGGRNATRYD